MFLLNSFHFILCFLHWKIFSLSFIVLKSVAWVATLWSGMSCFIMKISSFIMYTINSNRVRILLPLNYRGFNNRQRTKDAHKTLLNDVTSVEQFYLFYLTSTCMRLHAFESKDILWNVSLRAFHEIQFQEHFMKYEILSWNTFTLVSKFHCVWFSSLKKQRIYRVFTEKRCLLKFSIIK